MGNKKWPTLVLLLCGLGIVKAKECKHVLPRGEGSFSVETEDCINGTLKCYKKNFKCEWTIEAAPEEIVMLTSDDFNLEPSENCVWDYLNIVEGSDSTGTKHCGWTPLFYISNSNKLKLNFKSDETYEGTGFTFQYKTYLPDSASPCNTSIVGGPNGKIYNVADETESCFYSIMAPEDKVVQLKLKVINFGANDCLEEQLKIYAGPTSQGEVLKTWCSDDVAEEVLTAPTQAVFIEYLNNIQMAMDRFTIEYQFVDKPPPPEELPTSEVGGQPDCSGLYTGNLDESGVLTINAPAYQSNRDCVIVVRNTILEKGVVQVTFNKFHLEESENCVYDYLKVQSGERDDSQMLGGPYCGKTLQGKTLVTYGNSLRMEFKTDESLSWLGMEVKISIVPMSQCNVCKRGVCVLQGYEKVCIMGKQCKSDTCDNGGTCVETGTSTTCYCRPGFTGDTCSIGESGIGFIEAPKYQKIKKGSDIFPQCYAEGAYGYDWYLNDNPIGEYNKKTRFGTHQSAGPLGEIGTLQIDDISEEQEGIYTCIAKTENGNAEHTFEIVLLEDCDVEFTQRPFAGSRRTGDTIMIPCATKSAKTIISWKKADYAGGVFKTIDVGPDSRFEQQRHTNFLVIKDAKMEDNGIYRCVAEDTRCSSSRETELKVLTTKAYNKYCGISRHDEGSFGARIFKGKDARPGEEAWYVAFRTNFKGISQKDQKTFCGGSLVSTKYVVTAAHCVEEFQDKSFNVDKKPFSKSTVNLLFGTTNCKASAVVRSPQRVIVHPDFNITSYMDSDIAIIQLDSPVELDKDIRSICLENDVNLENMFFENKNIFGRVAGCGLLNPKWTNYLAKRLQVEQLPYVDDDSCQVKIGDWNYAHPNKPLKVTENMICAGFMGKDMADTCADDSGGPYIMYSNKQWYLVGIVSWGHGCGTTKMVGFYTNTGKFYDWIKDNTDFYTEECDNCDWGFDWAGMNQGYTCTKFGLSRPNECWDTKWGP